MTPEQKEDLRIRKEHQQVIVALRELVGIESGKTFIKYLFRNFDVGEMPEEGAVQGDWLMERLGFLRAGNSIFKIVAEADFSTAGILLGQIQKEKYDEKLEAYIAERSE